MKRKVTGLATTTVKPVMVKVFGEDGYRKYRRKAISKFRGLEGRVRRGETLRSEKQYVTWDCEVIRSKGLLNTVVEAAMPQDAARANFDLVTKELSRRNIEWWLVAGYEGRGLRIGIHGADRWKLVTALQQLEEKKPVYVGAPSGRIVIHSSVEVLGDPIDSKIYNVAMPLAVRGSDVSFGMRYGCNIEVWETVRSATRTMIEAPRENRAAKVISAEDFSLVPAAEDDAQYQMPSVLTRRMLDDIAFPIDAVYTWVDGSDSEWIESKRRLEAQLSGLEYHAEANHEARFESRDELKYSLRSIEMFAPWFRKIFIVTSGQVPAWLNLGHPKIELITHSDIYDNEDHLPTFNSNSIISRLHHIPGLSEHFVYFNDDVMLGKPVSPHDFFYSNGISKVFPSRNHRPFGQPTAEDGPHFNLTRNIRQLLEGEFGITIARAVKHTPYASLRSVHFEMEERFRSVYENTWNSRFRHHTDIVSDQLFHYYSQITGRGIPGSISYRYVNIRDIGYRWILKDTLKRRNRSTLCLNDAPVEGVDPIPEDEVLSFLESYFPVKSSFEESRTGPL